MSRSFKDAQGRTWEIAFDVIKIERIRDRTGFDPVDMKNDPFQAIDDDPVLLARCLCILCEDQHTEVTADQFGEALVGDVIAEARDAYIEALIYFFPTRKQSLLRSLVESNAAIREKAEEQALEKIKDPATREKVRKLMNAELDLTIQRNLMRLQSAMNSPEYSESDQTV